jgi:hypothetical protein
MKEIVLIIDKLCGSLLNTVCVCVRVCVCVCAHARVRVCVCVHARMHACVCNPLAWGPVKVIFIAFL